MTSPIPIAEQIAAVRDRKRMKLIRIYQSDRGIWHVEFERDGRRLWSSLRTKDEREAKQKVAQWAAFDTARREGEDGPG